MSTKEKVLGVLLMPMIAIFLLSGMDLAESFSISAMIICAVSFVISIALGVILRRGE